MPDESISVALPGEERFLIVRLGSLGDVIHTLPAVHALRGVYPSARIDWLIDIRWAPLLDGNRDVTEVIAFSRRSWNEVIAVIKKLRAAHYTCALDFQSLYKSSFLAYASAAPRRVGFEAAYARERLAAKLYTEHVTPHGAHKVEHNLSLVEAVGARTNDIQFPLVLQRDAVIQVDRELVARGLREFFVLSPGGGWKSKCWPAERYGALYRELSKRYEWRGVVAFGPGEEEIASVLRRAAGPPEPAIIPLDIPHLMALLRRARFLVAGDTGPLHLAVALGTPVVALYGPTDPFRNGPYSTTDVILRNAKPDETTYRRGKEYSRAMLAITVEEVMNAIERRLGMR
jgi:heptosyltransferase-1